MNKQQFGFITTVSAYVKAMTQFPQEVADFIGCQFALESSYGESSLAHSNNNYCGMRNPLVRISCALHAGNGQYHWAQYVDLFACVMDYLLCLQYHLPTSDNYDNINRFSNFIKKFYCPEKDYIDRINKIYQQFKTFKS